MPLITDSEKYRLSKDISGLDGATNTNNLLHAVRSRLKLLNELYILSTDAYHVYHDVFSSIFEIDIDVKRVLLTVGRLSN